MVVTTVLEKNRDCPKLQFGSPDTFLAADTPLLLAFITSSMNFSRSSSEKIERANIIKGTLISTPVKCKKNKNQVINLENVVK